MALKSLNKHSGQPTFSKVKHIHQEYFLTIIPSREYDSNPLVYKMSVAIRSDLLLFSLSIGLSVFTDFKRMPEILKKEFNCLPEGDASHIHRLCWLFFLSIGLSTFTDFRRMPENLKRNPEELWQLDEHSPFPDEVEIVVPDDRSFKGHIRPKRDLDTPFTKDNIIEVNPMFLIAYIKSSFRKELCIGMYKNGVLNYGSLDCGTYETSGTCRTINFQL